MAQARPRFERERLRAAIQQEYSDVATNPDKGFHFVVGRSLAERLSYSDEDLTRIPAGALESFAGVGNPFMLGHINAGSVVIDVGSGCGMDALIASHMVGAHGRVIGVEMTEGMRAKAIRNAGEMNASNVEFLEGWAEMLPLPDHSVDVAISNGVINLCPDKEAVFREIYRVLKPGGRMQISDILLEKPVPGSAKDLIHLWTQCVAGGLLEIEYVGIIRGAGFREVEVVSSFEVFKDAPGESAAARYGAKGFNLRAIKP